MDKIYIITKIYLIFLLINKFTIFLFPTEKQDYSYNKSAFKPPKTHFLPQIP